LHIDKGTMSHYKLIWHESILSFRIEQDIVVSSYITCFRKEILTHSRLSEFQLNIPLVIVDICTLGILFIRITRSERSMIEELTGPHIIIACHIVIQSSNAVELITAGVLLINKHKADV